MLVGLEPCTHPHVSRPLYNCATDEGLRCFRTSCRNNQLHTNKCGYLEFLTVLGRVHAPSRPFEGAICRGCRLCAGLFLDPLHFPFDDHLGEIDGQLPVLDRGIGRESEPLDAAHHVLDKVVTDSEVHLQQYRLSLPVLVTTTDALGHF